MSEENCEQISLRQIHIQRKNLVQICRLTVKTLVDKASITNIDDNCEELINFCAAIEQILTYRQKAQRTWYGIEEVRPFWQFIQTSCRYLPNNCIDSISTLENVKSQIGKGRAWIRCVLMEKRLSEYLSHSIQQNKLVRRFYEEGSVMLSEDISMLCGVLLGLNSIDFSFCLKGQNQEFKSPLFIDYTPYLRFQQSEESASKDFEELAELNTGTSNMASTSVIRLGEDSWEIKYKELEKNHKTIKEQKGYLEELVRMREQQLQDLQRKHQNLMSVYRKFDDDSKRDRQQMENVVIELQEKLASVNSKYDTINSKYEGLVSKLQTGFIALEEVVPDRTSPWEPIGITDQQGYSRGDIANIPESAAKLNIPGNKTSHSEMKPESMSMLAMAGSFSSQSNEDTNSYYSNTTKTGDSSDIADCGADEAIVINFPKNQKQQVSPLKLMENMDVMAATESVKQERKPLMETEPDVIPIVDSSKQGSSSPEILEPSGEGNLNDSDQGEDNSCSSPEILQPSEDNGFDHVEDKSISSPDSLQPDDKSHSSDSSGIEEQYDMVPDEMGQLEGGETNKTIEEDSTATG